MLKILFLWPLFFPHLLMAITLPSSLTQSDRAEVTKIVGFGSSTKLLTHPYPLGGYSGFEVGLSVETINIDKLNTLGNKDSQLNSLTYPRVTVGKGLYYNVDIFLHFTPFLQQDEIFEYGGLLRWSFYQAEFQPVNLSIALHGNTINVGDVFVNSTFGADLIAGLAFDYISFYVGVGALNANSRFTGQDLSLVVTDSGSLEKEFLKSSHSFAGLFYQFSSFFLSLEVNRYEEPVYSVKAGVKL